MKKFMTKFKFISMFLLGLILVGTAIPSYAHSNTMDKEIFYIDKEGNKVVIDEAEGLEVEVMAFPCCRNYRPDAVRSVTLYRHALVPGQKNFCDIASQNALQCLACDYIAVMDNAWGHYGYHDTVSQPGYKNCPF